MERLSRILATVAVAFPGRERSRSWPDVFVLAVVLAGLVYTALGWTPSSYGVALGGIGAPGEGLVAGTPKPIRSDEWAVWTPFVQIAVNNGFGRFNALSPYAEDLRNFNALPLLDWGLAFKPQFWPFFAVDPAWAFSFSHAVFIVLFLAGYHRLFVAFGFGRAWSAAASCALFFTSYAQFWWTTTGPLLAIFPWLLLAALARLPWHLHAALMAYVTAFWLLSHLYPPVVIPLAFAGGALLLAFRPDALRPRRLLPCLLGAAVGIGLTGLYLHEPIRAMAATVYPGSRSLGGGGVPLPLYLAQFLPFLVSTDDYRDLLGLNICEVATGGSYLLLLALVFLDYGRLGTVLRQGGPARTALLRQLALPLAAFALMSVWMLAPVPSGWGRVLLWDKVPGNRMVFAAGLLLLVLALVLLRAAAVRLSWGRFAVAALTVGLAWAAANGGLDNLAGRLANNLTDLAILPPLAVVVWLGARGMLPAAQGGFALILCALAVNAVGFGGFNPIQSAWPIFHRPATPVTAAFAESAAAHPQGWVLRGGMLPGALMQGLGYRSLQHVQIAPALGFFRPYFPEMGDAAFNQLFNRYAHVQIVPGLPAPGSPQADVIQLPMERFLAPPPRDPGGEAASGTAK
ncbi:DUF7657 domain-containing protein [Azospirillum rugosum]|uniref:DUF7657 domain-containing protein n=1 Tax=Azospirillum rugosum TaxID=416170 RepID=A0ABS4SP93_9PROT|nr:hypothetical protein [Azospirillum rugosum]MBP2294373.1 hypothetical protein [Azospirillum rugosum]MDQ0527708.1 hypothetical protein [Azospirillum rugosum]